MGSPCPNQLQGKPLENLGELASRICYESLGLDELGNPRGRSTKLLHEHILQVINLSVHEHSNFTIRFEGLSPTTTMQAIVACINRKGIFVTLTDDALEITTNFRAILEWKRYESNANLTPVARCLRDVLLYYARVHAPMVFPEVFQPESMLFERSSFKTNQLTEDQAWITLWLYGSRGFTHEQVRHRFAMSQRSTRYVDEDGSPYIEHPLITKYLTHLRDAKSDRYPEVVDTITKSIAADRRTYAMLVNDLQHYGLANGLNKKDARKQARGAARGYLGNALASEMLFSAPVSGWYWILNQRASRFADAEIRTIYTPALTALRSSRFGHFFDHFQTEPAPDGMGMVLKQEQSTS
jgi:thymidylate synthase ThyX